MCVDTMEGFYGRGDCYSKNMVTWLIASEYELDIIVGEATMDDNALEHHLGGGPSPSVPSCSIVESTPRSFQELRG